LQYPQIVMTRLSGSSWLEDRQLHDLATSDVFWDEIAEITSLGRQDVYDLAVDGADNVTIQDIFAHSG
jgi:intein/homing endonuclease